MNILLDSLLKFWYIWLAIIVFYSLKTIKSSTTIKGYLGEWSVSLLLSRLDKTKYRVINNIMLQVGRNTTQIDHVVVSNYGIFIIETKNYKGIISGNEFDDNWLQEIKKYRNPVYNPLKQNYGHVQSMKEILIEFSDANYVPIVVFTKKSDLNINAKIDVIHTFQLLKTIEQYNIETLTDSCKDQIFVFLTAFNIDSRNNRIAHINAIKQNLSNPKPKSNNNHICPKCGGKLIFKNGRRFIGCCNYPLCTYTLKPKGKDGFLKLLQTKESS